MRKSRTSDSTYVLGEPEIYVDSPLKKLYLTLAEANQLVLLICDYDKLGEHKVVYTGRPTKKTMATYSKDLSKIVINKGYHTVHTILHEMAHNVSLGHSKKWCTCLAKYVELWETRWHLYFV
jgi:hypothetical protein